jgi:hypothetical protein
MVSGINWDLGCDTLVTDPNNPAGPKVPWCSLADTFCALNGDPVGTTEPCNRVATIQGSDPNKVYQGMISGFQSSPYPPESNIGYLENLHSGDSGLLFSGDRYDSHQMGDVLECDTNGDGTGTSAECPTTLSSLTWNPATLGPIKVTAVLDCDCRRVVRVPIVTSFPPTSAPNCGTNPDPNTWNKCSARITGFRWVFLLRPYYNGTIDTNGDGLVDSNDASDFTSQAGNGVQTIAALPLDMSNAKVLGSCFSSFKVGAPKKVRLIDG